MINMGAVYHLKDQPAKKVYNYQMWRGRILRIANGTLAILLVFIGGAGALSDAAISEKLWDNYPDIVSPNVNLPDYLHSRTMYTLHRGEQVSKPFDAENTSVRNQAETDLDLTKVGHYAAGWSYGVVDGNYSYVADNVNGLEIFRMETASNSRVHNINKGTNYTTIQAAIDDANKGDEIRVDNGTYYENLDITKSLTINGNDNNSTLIASRPDAHALSIRNINSANISGMSITGSMFNLMAGINVEDSSNVNISGVNIYDNNFGVYIYNSSGITVREATIHNNDIGLRIYATRDCAIRNNSIYSNRKNAYLYLASNDTLENNIIRDALEEGIYIDRSDSNQLIGNNVSNNSNGIYLYLSSRNNLKGSIPGKIQNNRGSGTATGIGLYLHGDSNNNNVSDLVISNNDIGIFIQLSELNIIHNVNLDNNTDIGLSIGTSNHNSINNTTLHGSGTGIWLESGSNYNRFMETSVYSNDKSLSLNSSNYNIFIDSKISVSTNKTNTINRSMELTGSTNNEFINISSLNTNASHGIFLFNSSHNNLTDISLNGSRTGIRFESHSEDNSFVNLNVSSTEYSLSLNSSNHNTFIDSKISVSTIKTNTINRSIELTDSNNNEFINISSMNMNASHGIFFFNSSNNFLANISLNGSRTGVWFEADSENNSFVNLKINTINRSVELRNSNYNVFINVSSLNTNASHGIFLNASSHNILYNATVRGSRIGIGIDSGSLSNNITGSNISTINTCIWLNDSSRNILGDILCTVNFPVFLNNNQGIQLSSSHFNNFSNVSLMYRNVDQGIFLNASDNNTFINIASSESHSGMTMEASRNNTLSGSNFSYSDAGITLINSHDNNMKNILLIVTASGINNQGVNFVSSNGNHVSNVTSPNNYIGAMLSGSTGNTISDSDFSSTQNVGITLLQLSDNNNISNNTLKYGKWLGINVRGSSGNFIMNNIIRETQQYSIFLDENSDYNNVSGNTISTNSGGIRTAYNYNNRIYSNSILNCEWEGVRIDHAEYTMIWNNSINNSAKTTSSGIRLDYAVNSNISFNNIESSQYGLFLSEKSSNNNIAENFIQRNSVGIYLNRTNENNTIHTNTITQNLNGISIIASKDNTIYNNIFNNGDNFLLNDYNKFNITRTTGTNILGGSYFGGNFWAYPNGTGIGMTCQEDSDSDGICNSNYTLMNGNIDYFPLVQSGYVNGTVMNNGTGIASVIVTGDHTTTMSAIYMNDGIVAAKDTGISTNTKPSGSYSLIVFPGPYNIIATSNPGYYPNSSIVVTAISGKTIVQDIELFKKPTATLRGNVLYIRSGPTYTYSAYGIRDIERQSFGPGSSTNITVNITNNINQALSLKENIPANWNLTRIFDDAINIKANENKWIWLNVAAGATKTVVYRLTSPANASSGIYYITGNISNSTGIIGIVGGKNTIYVNKLPLLTYITISPVTVSVDTGQTTTFTASPKDQYGNAINETVTWSSSNTTVGTISSTGVFTAASAGTTTIIATSGNVVSNPATVTVRLPDSRLVGDINGDNIVNYKDLGLLGASYGLSSGDAGYNANADLNGDGIVNYKDLGILGAHYGEQKVRTYIE